jgi:preprotein translocase subunit SecD
MKKKNLLTRVIIIAVVSIGGLYLVIGPRHRPTFKDFTWSGIKSSLKSNIQLGLDLRGGSHFVMRVKTEEYLKRLTDDSALAAQVAAKDAGIEVKSGKAETSGTYRITVEIADASKAAAAKDAIEKKVELADTATWAYSNSGPVLTWTMTQTAQRTLAENATQQAQTIIDTRINALGIVEPNLQRHGSQNSHQILLQMPGVQDPERVKEILKGESRLELVHVISPPSPQPAQTYATEAEAIASLGSSGVVPSNRRIVRYNERGDSKDDPNAPKVTKYVVIALPAIIDGGELRNASASQGSGRADEWEINFSLKKAGADKFGAWTGAHINEYMGVVLNDEVRSVAFIKSQIFDSGQITGRFTQQTAEDLALTLRSGALPASIEYLEERTVGPSLGQDSIDAGVRASLVGLIFVVVFMLFYYRGSGINAVVGLILNMILMLAGLIVFGATLTLPGIAGIILTIGMAVDSNVLVFERIREELRAGKTVPSAVEQGFDRAFITIIDTHVTTIVSSLFLFVFGTGPIRGFAVTLVIGLLVNLFSAVYVSRTIFIWLLSRKEKVETLSI